MSQNKIPVFLGEQKLLDALNEIIVQINNQSITKFEILPYKQKAKIKNSTIIADKLALQFLGNNDLGSNIKKIYLINNSKDLRIHSKMKSEIIVTSTPFQVNDFFERVYNDIAQELKNNQEAYESMEDLKLNIPITRFSNRKNLFDINFKIPSSNYPLPCVNPLWSRIGNKRLQIRRDYRCPFVRKRC